MAQSGLSQVFSESDSESAAGASLSVLQAVDGGQLTVPGDAWLLKADFTPQGPDLLLTGPDGTQVLIRDFFNLDNPPDLLTDAGAMISAELASKLAGPVASGQLALVDGNPFSELAQSAESIGRVEATDGLVEAIRVDGTKVTLAKGDDIFQGDTLVTGKGAAVGITFVDDTTFSLGEDGRMVIDEMVYDAEAQEGQFSANLVQGVFSFVSGNIAKTSPEGMTVSTPVATIGIRGTKVAGRAAQEGSENTISLLPEIDAQGNQIVGELLVTNQGGTVTLSAIGATVQMSSAFQAPPPPVTFSEQQIQQNFGGALTTLSTTAAAAAEANAAENAAEAEAAQADAEQAGADAEAAAADAEAAKAEAEQAQADAEASGDPEAIAAAEAKAAEAEAKATEAEVKVAEAEAKAAEAEAKTAEAEVAQAEADQANTEMQTQAQAFQSFGGPVAGEAGGNDAPALDSGPAPGNNDAPAPDAQQVDNGGDTFDGGSTFGGGDTLFGGGDTLFGGGDLLFGGGGGDLLDSPVNDPTAGGEDTLFFYSEPLLTPPDETQPPPPVTADAVNQDPVVGGTLADTLVTGGSYTLKTTSIHATDPDSPIPALIYTVDSAVSNGTLKLNGSILAVGDIFTQSDVDAGYVVYYHNGGATTTDAFTFTVSDGVGGTTASTSFNFTVGALPSGTYTNSTGSTLGITANITPTTLINDGTVNVAAASTITTPSTVTNNGTLNLTTGALQPTTLGNTGTINIDTSTTATTLLASSSVSNSGTVNIGTTVTGASNIQFGGTAAGVAVSNSGTVNLQSTGTDYYVTLGGNWTNTGTINADVPLISGSTWSVNMAEFTNSSGGILNIGSGAVLLAAYNSTPVLNAGSIMQGNGTFLTAVGGAYTYNGILNPGTDGTVGGLTLNVWDANFGRAVNMSSSTVLNIDIAGTTTGLFDTLAIIGSNNASVIEGTLNLKSISGYTPTAGDSFQVFTHSTASTGKFTITDDFGAGWYVIPNYAASALTLTVQDAAGAIASTTGNDLLMSTTANDTIDGNTGVDALFLNGVQSNYTYNFSAGGVLTLTDTVGTDGTDTISNVDTLKFTDGDIGITSAKTITGSSGNDTITVTGTTATSITGGAGNDTLNGGTGADTFIYTATALNSGDMASTAIDTTNAAAGDIIDFTVAMEGFLKTGAGGTALSALTANTALGNVLDTNNNIVLVDIGAGDMQIHVDNNADNVVDFTIDVDNTVTTATYDFTTDTIVLS